MGGNHCFDGILFQNMKDLDKNFHYEWWWRSQFLNSERSCQIQSFIWSRL